MAKPVEVKIDTEEINRQLQALGKRLSTLSPVMRDIAEIMLDDVEENFSTQRAPDKRPWKPLAESTIQQREKKGYWPGKILQMRGELAASIQAESGTDFAMVSTNKRYAAIHQFGGLAGRGRKTEIPERPFLGLSATALSHILNEIKDWALDGS
jgi:phage virion morphogenesis protein